jgi:superfamily I DNA and/or RNA helicase
LSVIIADAGKQGALHFSLVVVDEAAQATEVDALKTIAFVGRRTRVLLAGDHMQLGPSIISRRAFELQFHLSLMQRLVALDAYRQPGMCSALNVNYRSHPALIAVPSFLFYANSICCAPRPPSSQHDAGRLLGEWAGLPRRDFPLMFYGVAGVDSSPDGHGVRNSVEAKTLLFLASKLLEDMPWLSQSDIGVMAPFRLQVVVFCFFRLCLCFAFVFCRRFGSCLFEHDCSQLQTGAAGAHHVPQRQPSRHQSRYGG